MVEVFRDLFALGRRQSPRLTARWFVDLQVAETGAFVGFFTRDVSSSGVRLVGESAAAFRRFLTPAGTTVMLLRVPGHREVLRAEAELRWGLGEDGDFQSGWRFKRISRDNEEVLRAYIAAHPEDLLQAPGDVRSG